MQHRPVLSAIALVLPGIMRVGCLALVRPDAKHEGAQMDETTAGHDAPFHWSTWGP